MTARFPPNSQQSILVCCGFSHPPRTEQMMMQALLDGDDGDDDEVDDGFWEKGGPRFRLLKQNKYIDRPRKKDSIDTVMKCTCEEEDGLFSDISDIAHPDCLPGVCDNALMNIECVEGFCAAGASCRNQRREYWETEVFKTDYKGHGLRNAKDMPAGTFVIQYCGEVLNRPAFRKRVQEYGAKGVKHFYFMSLNSEEVIDAGLQGNVSRFLNHSCDPNCTTQKWRVNGEDCIGFFAIRDIEAGEELTFDYRFEVYGEEMQKCFCGAANCRGVIGRRVNRLRKSIEDGDDDFLTAEQWEARAQEAFQEELGQLLNADGELISTANVLPLSKLMYSEENWKRRMQLLELIVHAKDDLMFYFVRIGGLRVIKRWCQESILNEGPPEALVQLLNSAKLLPVGYPAIANTAFHTLAADIKNSHSSDAVREASEDLLSSWKGIIEAGSYQIPKKAPKVIDSPSVPTQPIAFRPVGPVEGETPFRRRRKLSPIPEPLREETKTDVSEWFSYADAKALTGEIRDQPVEDSPQIPTKKPKIEAEEWQPAVSAQEGRRRFKEQVMSHVRHRLKGHNKHHHLPSLSEPEEIKRLTRFFTHEVVEKERKLVEDDKMLRVTDQVKRKIVKLIDHYVEKKRFKLPPGEDFDRGGRDGSERKRKAHKSKQVRVPHVPKPAAEEEPSEWD